MRKVLNFGLGVLISLSTTMAMAANKPRVGLWTNWAYSTSLSNMRQGLATLDIVLNPSSGSTPESFQTLANQNDVIIFNANSLPSNIAAFKPIAKKFVEDGGVIVEIRYGSYDFFPELSPATYASYQSGAGYETKIANPNSPLLKGITGNPKMGRYTYYFAKALTGGEEAVLTYSDYPVVTTNKVGKGHYIKMGYSYRYYESYETDFANKILMNAFNMANICRSTSAMSLDKTTVVPGEEVRIDVEYEHKCDEKSEYVVFMWRENTDNKVIDLIGGEFLMSLNPKDKFTDTTYWAVDSAEAEGSHTVGVRMIHPVTGDEIDFDRKTITVKK